MNRSGWIVLLYLDGSVLDTNSVILLLTLIALTGFLQYLRGVHVPCCRGRFVASRSLQSHRAPTELGSHQTTSSWWNKICNDSSLCLCPGWLLFETTFHLVLLTAHHSSLPILFGKPSSTKQVGCRSSGLALLTLLTHSSVTGLLRWMVTTDEITDEVCLPYYTGISKRQGLGLSSSES